MDTNLQKTMLRSMLRIRRFEEQIWEIYTGGLMHGLAHLYIGEEAVAVGVCSALRDEDFITSTHRGHGHCVAKGGKLDEMMAEAKALQAPYELVLAIAESGELPVVNFAAGGIATPADAALMMQLGCDGIFVGSGVFKSGDPKLRARAIVEATTFFNDPDKLAKVSENLGEAMVGINIDTIPPEERMQDRGL